MTGQPAATPPLAKFLARYREDDNEWWCLSSGHHQNLFDAAVERADMAEATVAEMVELIRDLADEEQCWYDHHGYCQAHGWMAPEPRCPHARAQELLAARAGEPEE